MLLSQLASPSASPARHIYTNSTCPNRRNPNPLNRLRTVSVTQGGGVSAHPPPPQVLLQLVSCSLSPSPRSVGRRPGSTNSSFNHHNPPVPLRAPTRTPATSPHPFASHFPFCYRPFRKENRSCL